MQYTYIENGTFWEMHVVLYTNFVLLFRVLFFVVVVFVFRLFRPANIISNAMWFHNFSGIFNDKMLVQLCTFMKWHVMLLNDEIEKKNFI